MGVIKQGILGGFSGKVGGVVGSSWKGISVMKSRPQSVANPKTAGQVAQRNKFSNSVAFAGVILSNVIKPLWDRFASGMSGYNDFISSNIDLFESELPDPHADLVISKGKMAATEINSVNATGGSANVEIDWSDDSGEGFKLATDEVYIVVVNRDQGSVKGFETGVVRSAETTIIELDANIVAGDNIDAYLAFKRADGTVVSNTSFKAVVAS